MSSKTVPSLNLVKQSGNTNFYSFSRIFSSWGSVANLSINFTSCPVLRLLMATRLANVQDKFESHSFEIYTNFSSTFPIISIAYSCISCHRYLYINIRFTIKRCNNNNISKKNEKKTRKLLYTFIHPFSTRNQIYLKFIVCRALAHCRILYANTLSIHYKYAHLNWAICPFHSLSRMFIKKKKAEKK